ncbi:MAG: YncE family protein [Caulobacteraceae bacterium]
MGGAMRTWARWTLVVLGLVVAIALAVVAVLAWPGRPSGAHTLAFRGYIPLPARQSLSILDYLTLDGRRLFVTSESSGDVYRIDLGASPPDRSPLAVFRDRPAAHGVVIDPASGLGFVTRSEVNAVDVFDPNAMRRLKRIPVAADPDGLFYDPAQQLIYAASGDSKLATLIDPKTQSAVGTIALGGVPEFAAFDPASGLFYQNLKDTDQIAVVDVAHRTVMEKWPLAGCKGPSGMAIDSADRRAFVVCSGNARLVIVDLDDHKVKTAIAIGGGPDSVAYDAPLRRIYTTGRSGVLSVVARETADFYRKLEDVRLHYGAHTLAVDPSTHSLYVGYASLLVRPRVAVFSPIQ